MTEQSNSTDVFNLQQGSSPLLVSMPHVGTGIPPELQTRCMVPG